MTDREYCILEMQAKVIADCLEQKCVIDVGDQKWKNSFVFGMIMAKCMQEEKTENPFNRFERTSYEIKDSKKRELRLETFIKEHGCSVDDPVRLGNVAYLFFDDCKRFKKKYCMQCDEVEINLNVDYGTYVDQELLNKIMKKLENIGKKGTNKIIAGKIYQKRLKFFANRFLYKFVWGKYRESLVKGDDIDAKAWVFQAWKKKWNEINDGDQYNYFVRMFKYDYEVTCRKVRSNKTKNFWMKAIALIIIYAGTIASGVLIAKENVLIMLLIGCIPTFVGNFFIQWIMIKKYQETWARHEKHRFALDMEMFRFIARVDGYGSSDDKKIFEKAIMQTWQDNSKKFGNYSAPSYGKLISNNKKGISFFSIFC